MPDPSDQRPPSSRAGSAGTGWIPPSIERLQSLLPQYEILSMLGHGGMGAVYKGKQKSLDRLVAIKILPPGLDDDDVKFTERFKNEARTMAKMNHPGIVSVYDFGETAEGQLYFIMEYVDGTDVAQMIKASGKLPPDHALAITAHVCDALGYAHQNGVVHRDIKPANILINMQGQVKVADFGLAKMDDPSQTTGLTKTGMAMGTPDFVAPEALIMGYQIDGRADLYAVGVMLYQMLTGEIPRGMFMMPGIKSKGEIDPRFDAIIAKAMQTDREMRYQTAIALRKDLDVILTTPRIKPDASKAVAAVPQKAVEQTPDKRSAAVKPMGKGPRPAEGGSQSRAPREGAAPAAKPDLTSASPSSKSKTSLYLGIAAAAVIMIGSAVFLMSGGKHEPDPAAASLAPAVKTEPIKVTESPQLPLATLEPANAAATSQFSVPAASAAGASAGWTDSLAEWWDVHGDEKGAEQMLTREPGGSRIGKAQSVKAWEKRGGALGDVAIRATVSGAQSFRLHLRDTGGVGRYGVDVIAAGGTIFFEARGTGTNQSLKTFRTPPGFVVTDRHTAEFRAQGDTLTYLLDGQEVASAKDTRLVTGAGYLVAIPGTLVERLEYRELAAASPATPQPGVAAVALDANGPPGELFSLSGHTGAVRALAFVPSRSDRAVSASWDKTVRFWDLAARKELRRFDHPNFVNALAVTPDGRHVIAGDSNGHLVRWSLDTGQADTTVRFPTSGGTAQAISISSRRPFGVAATGQGDAYIFTLPELQITPIPVQFGDAGSVDVAFFPDGEHVLVGGSRSDDRPGRLCKLRVGDAQAVLDYPLPDGATVGTCDVSADGKWVAAALGKAGISVWDAASGQVAATIEKSGWPTQLRFVGDGSTFATAHHTGALVLWDRATGRELHREQSNTGWVTTHVAISDDARLALTGGGYRVINKKEDDGHYTLHLWRLPASVKAAPAATGEQWHDLLAEWWANPAKNSEFLSKVAGGSRVEKDKGIGPSGAPSATDIALRATIRDLTTGANLYLRVRSLDTKYVAALNPDGRTAISVYDGSPPAKNLASAGAPAGFDAKAAHTFEFRAEGDTLTMILDGKPTGTAHDSTLREGSFYFLSHPGTLIERLEYAVLGRGQTATAAAAEPAKPSTASALPAPPPTDPKIITLLAQYTNAVTKAAALAKPADKPAFEAELIRLKTNAPLPDAAEDAKLPAELKRLRGVLRGQLK